MESLKELYRIGRGPSSSHTMAPRRAAGMYAGRYDTPPDRFRVTLYGSLAATGRGHMTDAAIREALEPLAPVEISWKPSVFLPFHPNGMKFEGFKKGKALNPWTVYSTGGGALSDGPQNTLEKEKRAVYPLTKITDIRNRCDKHGQAYWEYVEEHEGKEVWDCLREVWEVMCRTIENGLRNEGALPGGLGVQRKAATYFVKAKGYADAMRNRGLLYSYALATSEENAAGGTIVTAPTCGSSGVLPAVLYHLKTSRDFMEIRLLRALATAGLFGNIVKENASISGAEVGCQGEIGVACAMAAAASCQLFGGSPSQIEYAAEMALEHHLGLTCDPVCGLVQIPCIERNAIAAARAFDTNIYATFSDGKHRVSFDRVVAVMKETGHDIPSLYKETAEGGLARHIKKNF
ncbi:MAG: L-serine ammonia-lyase, iron-sulfur-dependent, subunit alpha [Tannerella sp.]|nr:L-serine ammonia-lyase, iron-sulfur-dependent, subunit alpha [Tannerella sp.]